VVDARKEEEEDSASANPTETAHHFHDGLLPGDAAYKLRDVDAELSGGRRVTDGRSP